MRYLVTSAEMQEYDNNTINRMGIPALVLMERAALAVRAEILNLENASKCNGMADNLASKDPLSKRANVLIAVGSGNNGGDGLAVARLLSEIGFQVSVLECGRTGSETEAYQLQKQILQNYPVAYVEDIKKCGDAYDYIVDGIFGIGLSRTINENYKEILHGLNRMHGCKIAIDIPSGVDGTTGRIMGGAFRADVTVTFGFGKRGLYLFPGTEYAGRIVVAQMGIDSHGFFGRIPAMFTYDEAPEKLLPDRRKDGNKGTFGKVLLIAGWEQMAGAAVMSAQAVLQTGAGMVKVYCSEENREILQCAVPEVMYGNRDSLTKDMEWADVIVAGPGLGKSGEAEDVLEQLICGEKRIPLVLDADALNLIAGSNHLQQLLRNRTCNDTSASVIMTPHIGELARICGREIPDIKEHLEEIAKAVALEYHCVMVCKDARTLVYAKGQPLYLNITGNSGMATAGSGDVLSGIIGALLAQRMCPFDAAAVGVYLHGFAGDKASELYTEYGVTATKIIGQIRSIIS